MNELEVLIEQKPGEIRFNFEELKAELTAKMQEYQGAVFTEESKTIAKAELAGLRKLKEAVDKRRKEIKVQCMEPYTRFESQVKELLGIIDEPIALIDGQLKEMEEVRVKQRQADVRKIWEEVCGGLEDYLPLEAIYDRKWNNAGTSLKSIREGLEDMVIRAGNEVELIRSSTSDVKQEALDIYRDTRDLAKALSHINTYEENKKKVLEQERIRQQEEEERRHQAELDRARAEERRHLMEMASMQKEQEKPVFASDVDESDELPFEVQSTRTVSYRIVATPAALKEVEMALDSLGVYYERSDG